MRAKERREEEVEEKGEKSSWRLGRKAGEDKRFRRGKEEVGGDIGW